MNSQLAHWETGFADCWDARGHYTKDTEPYADVTGFAETMIPSILAISELMKSEPNDETDIEMACASLILLGVSEFATEVSVDFSDVFDNDDELHYLIESMTDCASSHQRYKWDDQRLLQSVTESLEGYFND